MNPKKIVGFFLLLWLLTAPARAGLFSVTDAQMIEAGKKAHQDILKQYGEWKNPRQEKRVKRLGKMLLPFVKRFDVTYRFYLLNSDILNALATPDGSIHVTRGLVAEFKDDGQLLFILGHEITHVERRHGKQQAEKGMETQAAGNLLLMLVGGRNLASQIGINGAAYWLSMKYSRDFESQADQGGMIFLKKLGRNPHVGPEALNHLFRVNQEHPNLVQQYFGTHPMPAERVQQAEAFADQLSGKQKPKEKR